MATKKATPGELIDAAAVGAFVQLQKIEPAGSLQARKLKSGAVALYWRVTHEGKTDRVVIGTYDARLPPKQIAAKDGAYSIAGAANAAQIEAQRHYDARKDGGHRALRAAEDEAREAKKAAQIEASRQTVKTLVLAYCDHLKALGRPAHRDARSIFTLHVIDAHPAIAKRPAAAITDEDVADMLRTLYEAGKGRTANKLRSYLRAAYEVARRSRTDPKVPISFKGFAVRSNPVAGTSPITEANRADKNPLSADDLRSYWKAIEAMGGLKGAVLRLHLLTGAQRIEQLMRLKTADIDGRTIKLIDGKGRPGKPPRDHFLPLTDDAAKAMEAIAPKGEFALSLDEGESHIAPNTFSRWAAEAGAGIDGFQAKRLRSGVETLLSSAGVSKDTRGRLQSHGVSGVQAVHYDAHDYLPEKLKALQALHKLLTAKPADNVVPMGERAA